MNSNLIRKIVTTVIITVVNIHIYAAPSWGEAFKFRQPDGSTVPVLVWGDEFYQHVESPDGYTLLRDEAQWICYANPGQNGELKASSLRYTGMPTKSALLVQKHIAESYEVVRTKIAKKKAELNLNAKSAANMAVERFTNGKVIGITIIVDFSDRTWQISKQFIDSLLNQPGYKRDNNNGSVYDFYKDMSNGKLDYNNVVIGYIRAPKPKSYYDSVGMQGYQHAQEFLNMAVDSANKIFDFSTLTKKSDNSVVALNIMYAGVPEAGWANGLWPHKGGMSRTVDGVKLSVYQMTNIGTAPQIGTFCHENGHMLCALPDLYDYDAAPNQSRGTGNFDLMSGGSNTNPLPLNCYFREICGWETTTDISGFASPQSITLEPNVNQSIKYVNPRFANEAYYAENRTKSGRSAGLPGSGLLIWHIDNKESNDNQEMHVYSHYYATVVQADGKNQLELNQNGGDANDFWGIAQKSFSDATTPSAKWWDGWTSGLELTDIKGVGGTMTMMAKVTPQSGPQPVQPTIPLVSGLAYNYYTGTFTRLYDFQKTTPATTGTNTNINTSVYTGDNFALQYNGFIDIPASGNYSFQLTSDDGSALWIGNQLIVDNDGQHTSRTYTGDIALNKGKYPIKVDYFDYTSSQTLVVKWKIPGTSVYSSIPNQNFWYDPGYLPSVALFDSISGLDLAYYQEDQNSVDNLNIFVPVWTRKATEITADVSPSLNPFGLIYSGYVLVPTDEMYTLYLSSDDGSKLFIDNNLIINNDSIHTYATVQGKIGLLKGFHKIEIRYINNNEPKGLTLEWQTPTIARSPIDGSRFWSENRTRRPFIAPGFSIPGTIFLTEYDKGGPDVAYYDKEKSNTGGLFRPYESVDIDSTTDWGNGFVVTNTNLNEWLLYTIATCDEAIYTIGLRASALNNTSYIDAYLNDAYIGKYRVYNTGDMNRYQTYEIKNVVLPGLTNGTLKLISVGARFNMNYLSFVKTGETANKSHPSTLLNYYFQPGTRLLKNLTGHDFSEYQVQIIDITGRTVYSGPACNTIKLPEHTANGLLILHYTNHLIQKAQKILIY